MPVGWIAAVEAIILKMPTRDKTPVDKSKKEIQDPMEKCKTLVQQILQQYPQHKRVLYFNTVLQQRKSLNATEQQELEKFHRLLIELKN